MPSCSSSGWSWSGSAAATASRRWRAGCDSRGDQGGCHRFPAAAAEGEEGAMSVFCEDCDALLLGDGLDEERSYDLCDRCRRARSEAEYEQAADALYEEFYGR